MPAKCSSCGAVLPADAPGGHCVSCLLQLGLASAEHRAAADGLLLKPGDRIGHYRLVEQIGEGGCGVVFLAEQDEPVRRNVALKVIKLGMDTRQVMARFEAERQVLALLDHPNIARVLDAGATETGRPFFVMELVRGVKITEYCDRHKLATRERLELFVQVCSAVQHAHQKGIIHRDLKPSNILVTGGESGQPASPRIIDFGIAKSTEQRLTEITVLTVFQQFLGTPAYMSPEQAALLDTDTRADIYSLGVLLYELLTGLTPFDAAELHRCALEEVLRFIRETEPPRPSARLTRLTPPELTSVADCRRVEPARLPRLLQGDLDWIVMKCLEKDRQRRYETAASLGADLLHHLNHEPVLARPPSNAYRFQKWVRRHRVAFAAASAVLLTLIIGLTISTWMYWREKADRARAVHAEAAEHTLRLQTDSLRAVALAEAGKSREVAGFLETMLAGVGPSVALGRDTAMLREILDQTDARISHELKDQPEVEAELRSTLAETYRELGQYQPMAAMAGRTLELLRPSPANESPAIARVLSQLGDAQFHLGDLASAETTTRAALAMRQKLFGNEHVEVAASLNDVGTILRARRKWAEAEAFFRHAIALDQKILGPDDPKLATALSNLGAVLWDQGQYAEAESDYRQALAIRRRLSNNDSPDLALSLNNLATVLLSEKRPAEAEAAAREALAMQRKLLNPPHPALIATLGNLAAFLAAQGKYTNAEFLDREALDLTRKLPSVTSAQLATRLRNLAADLSQQHKQSEADALLREAADLKR